MAGLWVQLDGRMEAQVRSSLAEALLKRASYDTAKSAAATVAQEVAATVGPPQK